ncbi:DUF6934 family protein [Mucilaginibacter pedocola]|uniref:Uncharacterized protein n=1 Tax=Mucilaginibacter pedocola TaxID=1792845 RepID=A0A1S9P678_9SPHI|nr:hypothetical protein [Mucilaginibacter pedocola]OOQ56445.1 hypothetical protein BC343_18520 [Mucilaginibacter pedocola]
MHLKHYPFFNRNDHHDYEFYSIGPKGRIKKMVTFSLIPNLEFTAYNLAFGDLNMQTGQLDDKANSNNDDRDIVLATVANTVLEFSKYHNRPYIYATGSTSSRTRLYQMGIAGLWEEISTNFEVFGLKNDIWYEFEPNNTNYEAFLVKQR